MSTTPKTPFHNPAFFLGTWKMRSGDWITITEKTPLEWDEYGNSRTSRMNDLVERRREGK